MTWKSPENRKWNVALIPCVITRRDVLSQRTFVIKIRRSDGFSSQMLWRDSLESVFGSVSLLPLAHTLEENRPNFRNQQELVKTRTRRYVRISVNMPRIYTQSRAALSECFASTRKSAFQEPIRITFDVTVHAWNSWVEGLHVSYLRSNRCNDRGCSPCLPQVMH